MSKGNMLLGHARGKVGSLVFSRSNGKQVVRARAEVVKNPQTESQMLQRIILNTVAQAYSKMSVIVDHSFEGRSPGQQSMSFFNSKNMDNLRAKIKRELNNGATYDDIYAFTAIGQNYFAPNEYMVAKGQLPEIKAAFSGSALATIEGVSANTYQGLIDAFGLQRGDQITFMTLEGSLAQGVDFHFARVILDPINGDLSEAPLSTSLIVEGAINKANGRNEGEFASLSFEGSAIKFGFSAKPMCAAAVIVSRKAADGTWLRSNAQLALNDAAVAGMFPSLGECLEAAKSNSLDSLNARYLNNSGTGRLQDQTPIVDPVTVSAFTVDDHSIAEGSAVVNADDNNPVVAVTISDAERTGLKLAIRRQGGTVNIAETNIEAGEASLTAAITTGNTYVAVILSGNNVLATSAPFTYVEAALEVSTITVAGTSVKGTSQIVSVNTATPAVVVAMNANTGTNLKLAIRQQGQTENVAQANITSGNGSVTPTLVADTAYVAVVLNGDDVIFTSGTFQFHDSQEGNDYEN